MPSVERIAARIEGIDLASTLRLIILVFLKAVWTNTESAIHYFRRFFHIIETDLELHTVKH
jgi:hypothetical protein